MISISDELHPLSAVPTLIPVSKSGKQLHVSVVYRWASSGCRGVVLETLTIAGRGKFTTKAALDSFFAKISGRAPVQRANPKRRQKSIEDAEKRFAQPAA